MHLIRLLHSGIHALKNAEILVDVGNLRDELLNIRAGNLSIEEVRRRAIDLDTEFQTAFERTSLPEQPNFEKIDAFLVEARRRMATSQQSSRHQSE